MSKIRRVDFSPDEWLVGTRELELDERGAYWDVCSLIYSRGGPILDDERWLGKALACDVRTWRRIRGRLLEVGKLTLIEIDGQAHLTNSRAEREIERAGGRIASAKKAADASAERRAARTSAEDRPDDRPEVPPILDRSGDEKKDVSANIKDLGERTLGNYQLSTTNQEEEITTTESVTAGALADDGAAPPPAKPDPKGARLPEDWRPEGELRQWTLDTIAEKGSSVSAGHELERFRDYWRSQPGAKGRKADWPATWRNWIRKAIDMEGKGNGPYRQGPHQARRRSAAANAAAFIAALGGTGDRGSGGGGG